MNGMFSEIGSFTSLITSSNDVPFGFGNIGGTDASVSPFRVNQQAQGDHQNQWAEQNQSEELKMQELSGGLMDQTVRWIYQCTMADPTAEEEEYLDRWIGKRVQGIKVCLIFLTPLIKHIGVRVNGLIKTTLRSTSRKNLSL
ncbi:OBF binding protein 4 [Prunus dulcis]|uniref:OBF binding protein 4 n=1 Tax=Prunus dulcis TaxID=3755 RepID=A0A4Y1RIZ5_PRUDU|nr:OBF binding protein 4 [Prunus dulcis]